MKWSPFSTLAFAPDPLSLHAAGSRAEIASRSAHEDHSKAHVSSKTPWHADAGREKRATGRSLNRRCGSMLEAKC